MPAKGCDEPRHVVELASRMGQTGKVFKVHTYPVIAVEQPTGVDDVPANERGGRWNVAAEIHQDGRIEVMFDLRADDFAGAVDKYAVAIDDIGLGVSFGCMGDRLQAAGKVVVVGVEPAHQVSGGAEKTFVDGVGLSLVGLRNPLHLGKAVHNLAGVVGGSTVHDDVLHAWSLLANDAQKRVFEELSAVAGGSDDGKSWDLHMLWTQFQASTRTWNLFAHKGCGKHEGNQRGELQLRIGPGGEAECHHELRQQVSKCGTQEGGMRRWSALRLLIQPDNLTGISVLASKAE